MSWSPAYESGDFIIEPNSGRFRTASGELKLAQDLANALMTNYDASRDYGSEISSLLGTSTVNPKALFTQMVADAVARLRAKQVLNPSIEPEEQIASTRDIRVAEDPSSKTKIYSLVKVLTVAGQEQTSIVSTTTQALKLDHQYFVS